MEGTCMKALAAIHTLLGKTPIGGLLGVRGADYRLRGTL